MARVSQATEFSKNGVSDWLIQRVSAIVLTAYTLCILAFVVFNSPLEYQTWKSFFDTTAMQVFTLLALLATCAHAWIGMWTVGGDYLQEHLMGDKATSLRFIFQVSCILIIVAYFLWGINILWGN